MDYSYDFRCASQTYAPATDRKGVALQPGDRVSFKLYPRGTAEGVVEVSSRKRERLPDGTWLPALVINSEGKQYELTTKGTVKL